MTQAKSKGFTLIELMVVVAIIGVLAALSIPAITNINPEQEEEIEYESTN